MIMLFSMTSIPWSCYFSWWPWHDLSKIIPWRVWITMIIACHSMIVMFDHGCQPGLPITATLKKSGMTWMDELKRELTWVKKSNTEMGKKPRKNGQNFLVIVVKTAFYLSSRTFGAKKFSKNFLIVLRNGCTKFSAGLWKLHLTCLEEHFEHFSKFRSTQPVSANQRREISTYRGNEFTLIICWGRKKLYFLTLKIFLPSFL